MIIFSRFYMEAHLNFTDIDYLAAMGTVAHFVNIKLIN